MPRPNMIFVILLWTIPPRTLANTPPVFVNDMNNFQIPEHTQPGSIVYQLVGKDNESDIVYEISGTDYFKVNYFTGSVILAKSLQSLANPEIPFVVSLQDVSDDGSLNPVKVEHQVVARIVKDITEPPISTEFQKSENLPSSEQPVAPGGPEFSQQSFEIRIPTDFPTGAAIPLQPRLRVSTLATGLESILGLKLRPMDLNGERDMAFEVVPDKIFGSSEIDIIKIRDISDQITSTPELKMELIAYELNSKLNRSSTLPITFVIVRSTKEAPKRRRGRTFFAELFPGDVYLKSNATPSFRAAGDYKIDDPSGAFGVDGRSGLLFVKNASKINWQEQFHNLTVSWASNGFAAISIALKTAPDNSKKPHFELPGYEFFLPPDALRGHIVGTVNATAPGQNLHYTIAPGSQVIPYYINHKTGDIIYNGDTILFPQESFVVSAIHTPSGAMEIARVRVMANQIAAPPELVVPAQSQLVITLDDVSETTIPIIGQIWVSDENAQSLSFSVENLTRIGGSFEDRSASLSGFAFGNLNLTNCLDCPSNITTRMFGRSLYLTEPNLLMGVYALKFRVRIEDTQNPHEKPLYMEVLLAQKGSSIEGPMDTAPRPLHFVPEGPFIVSVPETAPLNSYIFTVVAYTRSEEPVIVYSFTEPSFYFSIDRTLGVILLQAKLDYDFIQTHTVGIRALNQRTGEHIETKLTVNVENVANHLPEFPQASYKVSIPENSPPGTVITTIRASDKDNRSLSYQLQGNQSDLFQVSNDGEISLAGQLDREHMGSMMVLLVALDTGSSKRASVPIFVTVLDENDHDPQFSKSIYSETLVENIPPGVEIFQMDATDLDLGPGAALEFSLVGLDPQLEGKIVVDPVTGSVTVLATLIGLSMSHPYSFSAMVKDGGGRNSSVPVKLTIQQTSRCTPTFVSPPPNATIFSLSPNAPQNTLVAEFKATSYGDCKIDYKISGRNPLIFDLFSLDPKTGSLVTMKKLQGMSASIPIIVTATAGRGKESFSTQIEVEVRIERSETEAPVWKVPIDQCDMPDCDWVNKSRVFVFDILGNHSVVGQVKTLNSDLPYGDVVTYELVESMDSDLFWIDESSGVIRFGKLNSTSNSNWNVNMKREYKLQVTARKEGIEGARKSRADVVIRVTSVSSGPPQFDQELHQVAVPSDASLGHSVLKLFARNLNSINLASDIRYGIRESAFVSKKSTEFTNSIFGINEFTGQITVNSSLVRHTDAMFNLTVASWENSNPDEEDIATVLVWIYQSDHIFRLIINEDPDIAISNLDQTAKRLTKDVDASLIISNVSYHRDGKGNIASDRVDIQGILVNTSRLEIYTAQQATSLLNVATSSAQGAPLSYTVAHDATTGTSGFPLSTTAMCLIVLCGILFLSLIGFLCFVCYLQRESRKDDRLRDLSPPKAQPVRSRSSIPAYSQMPVTVNPLCIDNEEFFYRRNPGFHENPDEDYGVATVEVPDYTGVPDVVRESVKGRSAWNY